MSSALALAELVTPDVLDPVAARVAAVEDDHLDLRGRADGLDDGVELPLLARGQVLQRVLHRVGVTVSHPGATNMRRTRGAATRLHPVKNVCPGHAISVAHSLVRFRFRPLCPLRARAGRDIQDADGRERAVAARAMRTGVRAHMNTPATKPPTKITATFHLHGLLDEQTHLDRIERESGALEQLDNTHLDALSSVLDAGDAGVLVAKLHRLTLARRQLDAVLAPMLDRDPGAVVAFAFELASYRLFMDRLLAAAGSALDMADAVEREQRAWLRGLNARFRDPAQLLPDPPDDLP
jgi:hypothetical protein